MFVAGNSKAFNRKDLYASLLIDQEYGLASDYVDFRSRVRIPTIKKAAVKRKLLRENVGEEMRVLYVALTRAKQKLILSGTIKDEETYEKLKNMQAPLRDVQFPENYLLNSRNPMVFFIPAVERMIARADVAKPCPVTVTFVKPSDLTIEEIKEESRFGETIRLLGSTNGRRVYDSAAREIIEERFSYVYPYEGREAVPAKVSVSELKHGQYVDEEAEERFPEPEIDKAAEAGGAPLPDQALAAGLERIYSRRYAHENLRGLYTKTSVSELKIASLEEEEGAGAYELFPENRPSPVIASFAVSGILPREEAPQEGIQGASGEASGPSGFSGTEYGTAVHRLLELFDYRRFSAPSAVSRKELDEWREELAASGRIPASYADQLPVSGIMAFLGSGLAARMAKAASRGELFREQPFVLGIEASRVNPSFPEEETMLVQGIIDAYFEEEGELVLVDYKTDRVSEEQELTDRYKVQLDLYERALEQITGKKVKEKLIYSVSLRKTVRL